MYDIGTVHTGRPRRLTRTDFVRYAGISGDFQPMHHDEVHAREAGEPSVFGHGMFSAGLLATDLSDLVGPQNLLSYRVRFTKPSRPGDVVVSEITVAAVDEDGARVDLECVLRTDAGEVIVRGTATAAS